ncbi:unannotated protein [freshwater metagenome]|uniref:Unannotated protein n=1 Tax=freshwater metagenome TaxID=449393 RepID=A0A6J6U5N1_9ZZZZ
MRILKRSSRDNVISARPDSVSSTKLSSAMHRTRTNDVIFPVGSSNKLYRESPIAKLAMSLANCECKNFLESTPVTKISSRVCSK